MPKITFMPLNKTVDVPDGTSVLQAALLHGVDLEHACGGHCACATCHVYIVDGASHLPEVEDLEADQLEEAVERRESSRLGCQLKPKADVIVEIPNRRDR